MKNVDRWLLPDGVDEVLPEQALVVERLRRELLDLYHRLGLRPRDSADGGIHRIPAKRLRSVTSI